MPTSLDPSHVERKRKESPVSVRLDARRRRGCERIPILKCRLISATHTPDYRSHLPPNPSVPPLDELTLVVEQNTLDC